MFKKISLLDALKILTTDKSARKDVYFAISSKVVNEYNTTNEDLLDNGTRVPCVRVDCGMIYGDIKSYIYDLASKSLFGGIYVRKEA